MKYRYNKQRDESGLLLQDREVMELLLRGNKRSEIAEELGMPLGTVNTCCTRIYRATGCKSQVELFLKKNETINRRINMDNLCKSQSPPQCRSRETYLILKNESDVSITTAISEVDNRDWDGDSRPDMNFDKKVLVPQSEYRQREEINAHMGSNGFRIGIIFNENGAQKSFSFRIDQREAGSGFYRTETHFTGFARKWDVEIRGTAPNNIYIRISRRAIGG